MGADGDAAGVRLEDRRMNHDRQSSQRRGDHYVFATQDEHVGADQRTV
jgi:hypothetical protein